MKKENLIIIGAIVIVIIAVLATVFLVFNNETEYTTLQISKTCSLQVPVSNDADSSTDNYGIFYYVDKEHDLNITGFNSVEGVTLSGAVQMASLRDSQQLNSQVVVENGTSIYYNKDTGIYTIFIGNDTTHDNILISTHNKDLLLTIVNSVNYGGDNQDNNSGNNNSATVDVSSKIVKTQLIPIQHQTQTMMIYIMVLEEMETIITQKMDQLKAEVTTTMEFIILTKESQTALQLV